MHKTLTTTAALLVLTMLAGLTACQTSRPGAENFAGEISAHLDATPDQIIKATKQTFIDMKLITVSAVATTLDGRAVARTATDDRVAVEVQSKGTNISEIEIRVGVFGDEALSLRILDAIENNLHAAR